MGPIIRKLRQKRLKFLQPATAYAAAAATSVPPAPQPLRKQIWHKPRRILLQRALPEPVIGLELHRDDPAGPDRVLPQQREHGAGARAAGRVGNERGCDSAAGHLLRGGRVVRGECA